MQTKTKQRWVGLLVFFSISLIFIPLLFHTSHPAAQLKADGKGLARPTQTKISERSERKRAKRTVIEANRNNLGTSVVIIRAKTGGVTQAVKKKTKYPVVVSSGMKGTLDREKRSAHNLSMSMPFPMKMPKAWCLQVGRFVGIDDAKRLLRKLRSRGYDAYTRSILDAQGKQFLQVFVGPEIHKERVFQLRDKLQADLHLSAVIKEYKIDFPRGLTKDMPAVNYF